MTLYFISLKLFITINKYDFSGNSGFQNISNLILTALTLIKTFLTI